MDLVSTSNLEFRTLLLCALSYGDEENFRLRNELPIFAWTSEFDRADFEKPRFLLFTQPLEKFLKTSAGQNGALHSSFSTLHSTVNRPWLVSSTSSHPALSKSRKETKGLGRSIYFAFRSSKTVRASGNAPDPGTHLVRLRL
jgi:hypothetical protein